MRTGAISACLVLFHLLTTSTVAAEKPGPPA